MSKSDVVRKLEGYYLKLMDMHGVPDWAIEEMEWEIFVRHGLELEQLDESMQWEVRNYMGGLKKLYGGK